MAKLTADQVHDLALYHTDILIWTMCQPWDDRFIPVIQDACDFRDELAREKMNG